jgi:hypothetical protein
MIDCMHNKIYFEDKLYFDDILLYSSQMTNNLIGR